MPHAGAPPEQALRRESAEEVRRWNGERERWERVWREARVRAAPIPKALAVCLRPLRLREGALLTAFSLPSAFTKELQQGFQLFSSEDRHLNIFG